MITVRPAVADDLPAIRQVGLDTWPPTYAFAGDDYVADGLARWWSDEALRQSLANTTTFVALDDDRVVGMGNVDLRGNVPIVWKLYVVPGAQGRGAGTALIEALVAAVPDDYDAIRLEYIDGNDRAAAFYAAHGFREVGRERDDDPTRPDGVWVERRLER